MDYHKQYYIPILFLFKDWYLKKNKVSILMIGIVYIRKIKFYQKRDLFSEKDRFYFN